MKKTLAKKAIVTATLFSMTTAVTLANAATMGRVIPSGTVTFTKNSEVIAKFTDQAPINDSALMTCDQACAVKLPTMSLNVSDGTTFAVRNDEGVMNLYVKNGLVAFTVTNVTQQVSFYTPDGRYVKSEGFISPTSAESNVKGFMNVTDSEAQIGINQGGMILSTANGVQTIDSGYTYKYDLNALPATSAGAMQEDDDDSGGLWAALTSSPEAIAATTIVAVGGIAIGAAAIDSSDDDARVPSPNQ